MPNGDCHTVTDALIFGRVTRGSKTVAYTYNLHYLHYTRVTLKRMAELLALSENETEDFLSSRSAAA